MANELELILKARDEARGVLSQFRGEVAGTQQQLVSASTQIAVATSAAGVALEALIKSQEATTQGIRRLTEETGIGDQEMRNFVASVSDAGFAIDEVIPLLEMATKQGLEGADALRQYAQFWDTVSDATGESSKLLAEQGVALRAVGIEVGQESQALNAFGFIQTQTTQGVSDFLSVLQRVGPEIRAAGLDINDTAAVLAIMEREFGLTGRTARSEFMAALNDAHGNLQTLLQTLGISPEVFAQYRQAVDESTGAIERLGQANESTITTFDRFKQALKEQVLVHGDVIQGLGGMAFALTALGPYIKGAAVSFGALDVAAGPWIAIAAAAVAVGGTLAITYKTLSEASNQAAEAANSVAGVFAHDVKDAIKSGGDAINATLADFRELESAMQADIDAARAHGQATDDLDKTLAQLRGGIGLLVDAQANLATAQGENGAAAADTYAAAIGRIRDEMRSLSGEALATRFALQLTNNNTFTAEEADAAFGDAVTQVRRQLAAQASARREAQTLLEAADPSGTLRDTSLAGAGIAPESRIFGRTPTTPTGSGGGGRGGLSPDEQAARDREAAVAEADRITQDRQLALAGKQLEEAQLAAAAAAKEQADAQKASAEATRNALSFLQQFSNKSFAPGVFESTIAALNAGGADLRGIGSFGTIVINDSEGERSINLPGVP